MADDELHAVADELVGDRDAFLGIGAVVADAERDLLAEDAAGGVDVLDGLLGAVLELRAEGGAAAGDRAGDAELDLGRGGAGADQRRGDAQRQTERRIRFIHECLPLCRIA